MAGPGSNGVVDTMVTLPTPKRAPRYEVMQGALGQDSGDASVSPVSYLFRDAPALPEGEDPVDHTLSLMDRFEITHGVVDIALDPAAHDALKRFPTGSSG
jgi:hypothetical protein